MSKSPPVLATAATAARVLGLSRRQFDRLHRAGVVPQHSPRQFDLAAVVPAYVTYIEQGRTGAATIAEAKLLTERERSRKLALENAAKAGELVYARQVADLLAEVSVAAVGALEAIPSRHAGELAAITDRADMRLRLQGIVREFRSGYSADLEKLADRLERR